MNDHDWKQRLEAAVEASGKSRRAISLAAGMGPGYVHSLLREGKEPTITSLIAICREIGVSATYIITGQEMSVKGEKFLALLGQASPTQQEAVLEILRGFASSKE